ncbi:MAG: (Fe-S)-binding protein [Bacteroidales bacterium]
MEKIDINKREKAIDLLRSTSDSKLTTHLNACVRCGLCATSCMYYLTFKKAKYIPAKKIDLVSSIYRKYCTTMGRVAPALVNAKVLDEPMAEEMVDSLFGACTMCGRCVKHCSIGVDIPFIVKKGREMLAAMDLVPKTLQSTVDAAITTGNNMGIPTGEFVDTIKWMEEELIDEMQDERARIPLDEMDKDIFYTLNPREPKFFPLSISAMAKIFYAANASWTLSSKYYDVTNYGYFNANMAEATQIARNLYNEVLRLRGKRLVLGECGHGSRANRWEGPNYLKKAYDFETITAVELIERYIRHGSIKLDKSLNKELCTIHDPCNLVRNGGLLEQIRFVVKSSVANFVEMNPYGNDNFCCGGGGGTLAMSEYNDRRLKIGEIKANQIRKSGAKVVITPCHNCVDQLTQLNHTYKLGVQIKTISEVVADALIITKTN